MFLSRYSLGARLAMGIFGLALLGMVAYAGLRLRAHGQNAIVMSKLGMVSKNIQDLADGLSNYHNVARTFLPTMMTPDGPTVDTENWGKKYPDVLGNYTGEDLSDPFSPDQTTPLRYWTDGQGWTIWSAGPDGDYDLKDPKIYGWPGTDAHAKIGPFIFNLNNGPISSGDVVLIYRPVPEE